MVLAHTYTESFTRTHARYLASKVVADLYQCARFYGSPSAERIGEYETELTELLVGNYVSEYEFGFKRNGNRIVSWRYRVNINGDLDGGDDHPGSLFARAKLADATYYNFMSYSSAWFALPQADRDAIVKRLPFSRSTGSLPSDGSGYWAEDRSYSNGGVSIARRTFRPS